MANYLLFPPNKISQQHITMDKITNTQTIATITNMTNVKRKIKTFLSEKDCADIRLGVFPQCLIATLYMVLDDIATNTIQYAVKHQTNGLYVVSMPMLLATLNGAIQFGFHNKYSRKYDPMVKYEDNLIFGLTKVMTSYEFINGTKLSFDVECKNYLAFIMMSLQYDVLELSILCMRTGGVKTMSKQLMMSIAGYVFGTELSNKITIKLDCMNEGASSVVGGKADDETASEIV